MKQYRKLIIIAITSLILNGCQLIDRSDPVVPKPVEKPDVGVEVVTPPPKIVTTDWKTVFAPLIAELIQTMAVNGNNSLLISDPKNNTEHYLSSASLNNTILNEFGQQNIFSVIDQKTVNYAKQLLGFVYDDELVSRGKMIALARQVEADYVLFTTINRVPNLPDVKADVSMELLLTKTGEIVWQLSSDQMVNRQTVN